MTIETPENSESVLGQDQLDSDLTDESSSETTPEISNENPNNLEVETEIDLEKDEPEPYEEINLELESFLKESTTTQAEHRENEREQKAKAKEQEYLESQQFSPEKAAGFAVNFIGSVINFAREQTGRDIQPTTTQVQIGAALFTPVIMKYGHVVENHMKNAIENVDGDSNLPEYLAGAGLIGMAGLLWKKSRTAPPIPKDVPEAAEFSD